MSTLQRPRPLERLAILAAILVATLAHAGVAHAQRVLDDPRWHLPEIDRSHGGNVDGPQLIDDPGGPVPAGWQRVRVPIRPLFGAGAAIGAIVYIFDLLGTVNNCTYWQLDCRLGWIPVAGPLILLAGGAQGSSDGGQAIAVGVLTGIEVLAAASTIVGLAVWEPHLRRRPLPQPAVSVTSGGASLSVRVVF